MKPDLATTICIIDDDLVSQFATVYCIEQTGLKCHIKTCDSAAEGLQLFTDLIKSQKPLPEILFLDLGMPEMDGWDFLEALKKLDGDWEKIDIYILSAFANSKDREKAKSHPGICGHFDKPLSKSVLEKIFAPNLH